MPYKHVIFDLDETLTESFQPPKPEMMALLRKLLEKVPVAIMTGAGFQRVANHVLSQLDGAPHISHLTLLTNSAAQAYTWQDGWNEEYNHAMSPAERERIKSIIAEAETLLPVIRDTEAYGKRISDREVQIAYTVVGLDAPQEIKMQWDPDVKKRREIMAYLRPQLAEYEIRSGGASTIDITKKGIDKAYGVRWLCERTKLQPTDMLYVGDALYEGGNDAVVIPTGIHTRSVSGPAETERVIQELLAM